MVDTVLVRPLQQTPRPTRSLTCRALRCNAVLPAIAWQVAAVGNGGEQHRLRSSSLLFGVQRQP
jgi:hypothetical protein